MKWFKQLVLGASIIFTWMAGFTPSVTAGPDSYRNYGQIRAGVFDFCGDLDDDDYDRNGIIAVSYGRNLTPYLVAEATVEMFSAEKDADGLTERGHYDREDQIDVFTVLGTLKAQWPVGPVTIFAGGGAGYYSVTLDSEIDPEYRDDRAEQEWDGVFGLHAVTGVNVDIWKRFFAGFEGMYRWTDDVDINESIAGIPVRLEGDLTGYAFTLTAGFRF